MLNSARILRSRVVTSVTASVYSSVDSVSAYASNVKRRGRLTKEEMERKKQVQEFDNKKGLTLKDDAHICSSTLKTVHEVIDKVIN